MIFHNDQKDNSHIKNSRTIFFNKENTLSTRNELVERDKEM